MVFGSERVGSLKAIALGISRSKQSEEPAELGLLMLRDIRDVFHLARKDRLPSSVLLKDLGTVEESPWPTWSNGRGLDARSLARYRVEQALSPISEVKDLSMQPVTPISPLGIESDVK
jgi:hypothetical protein